MPTGYKQARENMNDTSNVTNIHNGHEFVDLGLHSELLWATCNVGANSPEQAGLYFAFGETKGFTAEQVTSGVRSFDLANYTASKIFYELTLEEDAAHVHMGGEWRMPTYDECQELIDNCNVVWTKDYNRTGVAGRVFTSKVNGKSVFFPAAGYCYYWSVLDVGSRGSYWSATCLSSCAWGLGFGSGDQCLGRNSMYYGFSVRGVCEA